MSHIDSRSAAATQLRHDRSALIEWGALIVGIAITLGALLPPVDAAADRAFSAHMLQHMALIDAGAPMLAIAWSLLLGRWRSARFAAGLTALARPLPALILSTASLWFWHIPAIYDAASASDAIHAVEHGTLIAAFALFWRPLLSDAAESLRTNASRTLYLSVSMFATGLTAALITFADHPLYSHYRLSPPSGRSALSDQRLGGGMMWLIGTVAITVAALLTMRDEE